MTDHGHHEHHDADCDCARCHRVNRPDEPWPCTFCGLPYQAGEDAEFMNNGLFWAHRECLLRNVMGGIGHLEDHNYWCNEKHDPDGGRTYRQSALEVDQWVHRRGVTPDR